MDQIPVASRNQGCLCLQCGRQDRLPALLRCVHISAPSRAPGCPWHSAAQVWIIRKEAAEVDNGSWGNFENDSHNEGLDYSRCRFYPPAARCNFPERWMQRLCRAEAHFAEIPPAVYPRFCTITFATFAVTAGLLMSRLFAASSVGRLFEPCPPEFAVVAA